MKKIILLLLVSAVTLSARNSRLSLETSNVIPSKSRLSLSEVDKITVIVLMQKFPHHHSHDVVLLVIAHLLRHFSKK